MLRVDRLGKSMFCAPLLARRRQNPVLPTPVRRGFSVTPKNQLPVWPEDTFSAKPPLVKRLDRECSGEDLFESLVSPGFRRHAPIHDVAAEIRRAAGRQYGLALQQMRHLLSEHGQISGRLKSQESLNDKLSRIAQKSPPVHMDAQWAKSEIPDMIGLRLVLNQGTPQAVSQVVRSLSREIEQERLTVLKICNYHGLNSEPYLTNRHIQALAKAQHKQTPSAPGLPFALKHGDVEAIKESGYTAAQFHLRFANGALGELQIRGPLVDRIAQLEHSIYDLRKAKTQPFRYRVSASASAKAGQEAAIRALTPEQRQDYLGYVSQQYRNARRAEVNPGQALTEPPLPDSLIPYPHLRFKPLQQAGIFQLLR